MNQIVLNLSVVAASLGMAFLTPATSAAQDARSLAFLGCWVPADGQGPELCIGDDGNRLVLDRTGSGVDAAREVLSFSQPQRAERDGCSVIESARWADDGRRVLLRSEATCEGGVRRVESGVLSLPEAGELLDVRAVTIQDETMAWVQYYRLDESRAPVGVSDLMWEVSRRAAAQPIDIDDVTDALNMIDVQAVEAWVAETGQPFALDAASLVALSESGVPSSLLDVMIAVSNPDQFTLAVERGQPTPIWNERPASQGAMAARPGFNAWDRWGPSWGWGYSPWGWGYSPWQRGWFGYDPFFSPFGVPGVGWGGGWGGGWAGGWGGGVVILPGSGQGTREQGRVINGRGYRSGRSTASAGSSPQAGTITAPSTTGESSTRRLARPRQGVGASTPSRDRSSTGSTPSRRTRPSRPAAQPNSGGRSQGGATAGPARGGSGSGSGSSGRGSAKPRRGGGGG